MLQERTLLGMPSPRRCCTRRCTRTRTPPLPQPLIFLIWRPVRRFVHHIFWTDILSICSGNSLHLSSFQALKNKRVLAVWSCPLLFLQMRLYNVSHFACVAVGDVVSEATTKAAFRHWKSFSQATRGVRDQHHGCKSRACLRPTRHTPTAYIRKIRGEPTVPL